MAVTERKPQRCVKPVVIHTLTDFFKFVCISLIERAVFRIIQSGKPFQFQLLLRRTEVERTQVRITELGHEVVAEFDLFIADTFSFHDDDSVGSFFAIEDGGGGVLQHVNTFNVENIKVIEFLHGNLHAVQHDERIVHTFFALIGNQCVGTADKERRDGIRIGTCRIILDQHHTRRQGSDARNKVCR